MDGEGFVENEVSSSGRNECPDDAGNCVVAAAAAALLLLLVSLLLLWIIRFLLN